MIKIMSKGRGMGRIEVLDYLKTHQNFYFEKYGIRFVGIFGSVARNEANKDSDIDILYTVEKDRKLSLFDYLRLLLPHQLYTSNIDAAISFIGKADFRRTRLSEFKKIQ